MAIESIKQLENGVVEYDLGTAIVRIHPGKLTEEERNEVIRNAAKAFDKAIQRQAAQTKA